MQQRQIQLINQWLIQPVRAVAVESEPEPFTSAARVQVAVVVRALVAGGVLVVEEEQDVGVQLVEVVGEGGVV